MDLNDITEFLLSAGRSVGAEVASPWFYLQLGLILAGAGIGYAAGAAIRARLAMPRLAGGWRARSRRFSRGLVANASPRACAVVVRIAGVTRWHSTGPS